MAELATLRALSRSGLRLPWAARMQDAIGLDDLDRTEAARLRRPSVRWWWGRRRTDGGRGAVCYLCGQLIITWDGRWPITLLAQATITAHGQAHAQGAITAPPTPDPGAEPP